MAFRRWLFLCGSAFLACAETASSQRADGWRAFRASDGLPQSGCVSVAVSPQGKLLVRHVSANLASELDGYAVRTFPAPPNAIGRIAASPSGQLWAVAPQGLLEWRNGQWALHPIAEIAAALREGAGRIPLVPIRQGRVLFLLRDQLTEFNSENPRDPQLIRWRVAAETRLGSFSGMILARDGGLWISGTHGIAQVPEPVRNLKPDTEWREYIPPGSLGLLNFREVAENSSEGITTIADVGEQQSIVEFDGAAWRSQPAGAKKLFRAWRGPEKELWAVSDQALFRFDKARGELVESDELPARHYFDVGLEPGGAFWLATSEGLFRYAPPLWRTPAGANASVLALAGDSRGRLWSLLGGRLLVLNSNTFEQFPLPGGAARPSQSGARLYAIGDEVLFVSAEEWLRLTLRGGKLSAAPILRPRQTLQVLGVLRNGTLCVQDRAEAGTTASRSLQEFDGTAFRPWATVPPLGLGELRGMLQTRNGDLWLGGERGLGWWHDQKWRVFSSTDQTTPEAVELLVESSDERIWCAAQDRIWEFDGHEWSIIRVGFDQVNQLRRTRDGSIWVASNGGLFRFWQNAWIENGMEEGLAGAAVRDLFETEDRLWAATPQGLSGFHPSVDPDPPRTRIHKLTGDESVIPEGGTLNLLFNGADKWKFTSPGRLLYSYRLDQHDWSPFQDLNAVSFPDLASGKHYFQARAMDRNGNIEASPAQLEFSVALPWYRETRLVLATGLGLATALFFAGLSWNRHQRLRRSYAEVERKVQERTQQLEIANRELLHSQKMNALGTLAAGVAHDFNNILSIVKGSAQIIEENLDNPTKVRTRVDRIKTVVEQGSGIVKAMLGFSRDSDGELAWCDPNAVVEDTIKLLGDRFQREVEVVFQPTRGLPQVAASKDFIQQILLNFVFNAAEAMKERKELVIGTRVAAQPPPGIVLAPGAAASYVIVSVRDQGCGIPAANLPRIFEPFFTTKGLSARRGTGLGLSMAYELARKMSAGLAVESVVGQGSTFSLVIPVLESKESKT